MAAVREVVRLGNKTIGDPRWYDTNRVPVAFREVDPVILAYALVECGGDWFRCVVDTDGTVTVYNYQVWTP